MNIFSTQFEDCWVSLAQDLVSKLNELEENNNDIEDKIRIIQD